MDVAEVNELLKAAGGILTEQYRNRLEWLKEERAAAVPAPMADVIDHTELSMNKAMGMWMQVFNKLGDFEQATGTAIQTASEEFARNPNPLDQVDDDSPPEAMQIALAMRAIALDQHGNVLGIISSFNAAMKLGIAFATAELANVVSTKPTPRLQEILERIPSVAKNLGAAAVLGPIKDYIEAGFELFRKSREAQNKREEAADWFQIHGEAVDGFDLSAARLQLILLLVTNATTSMAKLNASE